MIPSVKEVRDRLLGFVPPGFAERWGPQLRLVMEGTAAHFRDMIVAAIERTRPELSVRTASAMLLDWEIAFALTETPIARFGTIAQRQAQVLTAWRAFGGSISRQDLRALLAPLLGVADPALVQIVETDRAALRTAHTYLGDKLNAAIGGFPGLKVLFNVKDDGPVSDAGAQMIISFSANRMQEIDFALYGPDGGLQQAYWPPGYVGDGQATNLLIALYAPLSKRFGQPPQQTTVAGNCGGTWTLSISNKGVQNATLNVAAIFVEAVGRRKRWDLQGLGSAAHEFAVVIDPAQMGAAADVPAANRVLQRFKPAWTGAAIVKKNAVMGGGQLAIPDEPQTIPDAIIPG